MRYILIVVSAQYERRLHPSQFIIWKGVFPYSADSDMYFEYIMRCQCSFEESAPSTSPTRHWILYCIYLGGQLDAAEQLTKLRPQSNERCWGIRREEEGEEEEEEEGEGGRHPSKKVTVSFPEGGGWGMGEGEGGELDLNVTRGDRCRVLGDKCVCVGG